MMKKLLPKWRFKLKLFGGIIPEGFTTYLIYSFQILLDICNGTSYSFWPLAKQHFSLLDGLSSIEVFTRIPVTLVRFSSLGENTHQNFWIGIRAHVITIKEVPTLLERWINFLHSGLGSLISQTESSGFILYKVRGFDINHCACFARQRLGKYVPYPQVPAEVIVFLTSLGKYFLCHTVNCSFSVAST